MSDAAFLDLYATHTAQGLADTLHVEPKQVKSRVSNSIIREAERLGVDRDTFSTDLTEKRKSNDVWGAPTKSRGDYVPKKTNHSKWDIQPAEFLSDIISHTNADVQKMHGMEVGQFKNFYTRSLQRYAKSQGMDVSALKADIDNARAINGVLPGNKTAGPAQHSGLTTANMGASLGTSSDPPTGRGNINGGDEDTLMDDGEMGASGPIVSSDQPAQQTGLLSGQDVSVSAMLLPMDAAQGHSAGAPGPTPAVASRSHAQDNLAALQTPEQPTAASSTPTMEITDKYLASLSDKEVLHHITLHTPEDLANKFHNCTAEKVLDKLKHSITREAKLRNMSRAVLKAEIDDRRRANGVLTKGVDAYRASRLRHSSQKKQSAKKYMDDVMDLDDAELDD